MQILRRKLNEQLSATVPPTAEQIHARHILVPDETAAAAVQERLKNGESFEALAAELSTDPGSKDQGGDLGWFPRGFMVSAFEEAAFKLAAGQVSDPVKTSFGVHLIKVDERETPAPSTPSSSRSCRTTPSPAGSRRRRPGTRWSTSSPPSSRTGRRATSASPASPAASPGRRGLSAPGRASGAPLRTRRRPKGGARPVQARDLAHRPRRPAGAPPGGGRGAAPVTPLERRRARAGTSARPPEQPPGRRRGRPPRRRAPRPRPPMAGAPRQRAPPATGGRPRGAGRPPRLPPSGGWGRRPRRQNTISLSAVGRQQPAAAGVKLTPAAAAARVPHPGDGGATWGAYPLTLPAVNPSTRKRWAKA